MVEGKRGNQEAQGERETDGEIRWRGRMPKNKRRAERERDKEKKAGGKGGIEENGRERERRIERREWQVKRNQRNKEHRAGKKTKDWMTESDMPVSIFLCFRI